MFCQIRRLFEHLSSSSHWQVMELQIWSNKWPL